MAIPDFQSIMRPVLAMLADEREHTAKEIRARMASHFSLPPEELEVMLPSGRAKLFANRVGWALTYLYQARLLERPRRAVHRITPRGHHVLGDALSALSQRLHGFVLLARGPDGQAH